MIRVSSFGTVPSTDRDFLIKKISRMVPFEWVEIPLKKCPDKRIPQLLPEEKSFLEKHKSFVLLDVTGRSLSSEKLTDWIFKADRHLVVGPAIGFHPAFFEKADDKLSMSNLTFTHGLAQLMLAESIYRCACILKNHPFVK
jgi:23S rRNA (pseudouridine1915-N3)-methyltransferase